MSNHPADLVERVEAQMLPIRDDLELIASYALDLAERAADAAVAEYRLGDMRSPLSEAVRRAVENA